MKILVAEDDFVSRIFMQKAFSSYGKCDVVLDGNEAIDAFVRALDSGEPYDLVTLDVMMPRIDGVKTLNIIRDLEKSRGVDNEKQVKIIITTALANTDYINSSFVTGNEIYLGKPIGIKEIEQVMEKFK